MERAPLLTASFKMHRLQTFALQAQVTAAVTADVFVKPGVETVSAALEIHALSMTTVPVAFASVRMQTVQLSVAALLIATNVSITQMVIKSASLK